MGDNLFDLKDRVAVITGGVGLLGQRHAGAILRAGGRVVLLDVRAVQPRDLSLDAERVLSLQTDIARPEQVQAALTKTLERFGRVDILVNNAANNPKVEANQATEWTRLENFPLEQWHADLAVGLTGAFLCSQVFGGEMARKHRGVIVNIASDLAVIAPDQRLYRVEGLPADRQPVKPVTYSVVKTALIGLTRYLATYWAEAGVRVNALSPGGIFNDQPAEFVRRLVDLIPLGRMANRDEYEGALLFLCSDASAYMTGTNLVIDGGRSCW